MPTSHTFYSFIESVAAAGIVVGYTPAQCAPYGVNGRCFLPGYLVKRAEAALVVQRTRNYPLVTPVTPTFPDVPTSYYAYPAIQTLYARGIISGKPCRAGEYTPTPGPSEPLCFLPNDPIRRGEMSKIVRRSIESQP